MENQIPCKDQSTSISLTKEEKIRIFMSLFNGRADVFAQRWESNDGLKSGYFPVFKDVNKTEYKPLTEYYIEEHLKGNRTIGIYPLLKKNTSFFVVADFDGKNWKDSIIKVLNKCDEYKIPSFVEKSRSGNGAHIWWFFEDSYPAFRGRKVFLRIIKEAGIIDMFDREESFDRLFPSQDYLSGKGFGNLIALPLQGKSRQKGNSVFVDSLKAFEQYPDQWELLQSIQKVSIKKLNELFNLFSKDSNKEDVAISYNTKEIPITIHSQIVIPKTHIFLELANFLTTNLNFFNTEFHVKQNMGFAVHNVEKFFKTIESNNETVCIPRGFLDSLLNYLKDKKIPFNIYDNRTNRESIKLNPTFKLFDYQKDAVNSFSDKDYGILVSPAGSGKTIIGLAIIANKQQPALIITHRKQIYNQWFERVEHCLQIPKKNIGQIAANKKQIKVPITIAMMQTLANMEDLNDVSKTFGTVILDECHHVPAQMFRGVIKKLNPLSPNFVKDLLCHWFTAV